MLELKNINKSFYDGKKNKLEILNNLNLTISKGEFVSIMGTSGVGKTTLLNIIGLLDTDFTGEYYFLDNEVSNLNDDTLSKYRSSTIGYVFQDYKLIDDFTVYENIQVALLINKNTKFSNISSMIKSLIKRVGLDESILNKKASVLSGGEKQRVAIARALSNTPSLLIADEPTGAIDIENKEAIMSLISDLNNDGITIVLVSHDKSIAEYADKIYTFENKSLRLN